MRFLATREQMARVESRSIELGLSAEILMEAASSISMTEIEHRFSRELRSGNTIIICCGPGNNGGDGYALARHLYSAGYQALEVVKVTEPTTKLSQLQLQRCLDLGIPIREWQKTFELQPALVIDALFGVGLNRPLAEPFISCIDWINKQNCMRVCLDIPSGLDSNRGVILGAAVKASVTLTYGVAKIGLYLHLGPELAGDIRVLAIGMPPFVIEQECTQLRLFDETAAARIFPRRVATANKSHFGRAVICAGSAGMWGAALLCAQACFRSGAGYVILASHEDLRPLLIEFPEIMTVTLAELKSQPKPWHAMGVGPGLGTGPDTKQLIGDLKNDHIQNVVIDADAFSVCVAEKLYPLPESWIVTPHTGELARLLARPAQEIDEDRLNMLELARLQLGCHIVLKGNRTLVAAHKGEVRVIDSGNVALAKGGSGDVLTGLVTGLLAQSQMSVLDALSLAVYVHGCIADKWTKEGLSSNSLQPSDLIRWLPRVLHEVENSC